MAVGMPRPAAEPRGVARLRRCAASLPLPSQLAAGCPAEPPPAQIYLQGLLINCHREGVLYQRQLEEHIILEAVQFADEHGVTLTGGAGRGTVRLHSQQGNGCTQQIGVMVFGAVGAAHSMAPPGREGWGCHPQGGEHACACVAPLAAYCGDRIVCRETDEQSDRLLFYKEPPPESVGKACIHRLNSCCQGCCGTGQRWAALRQQRCTCTISASVILCSPAGAPGRQAVHS